MSHEYVKFEPTKTPDQGDPPATLATPATQRQQDGGKNKQDKDLTLTGEPSQAGPTACDSLATLATQEAPRAESRNESQRVARASDKEGMPGMPGHSITSAYLSGQSRKSRKSRKGEAVIGDLGGDTAGAPKAEPATWLVERNLNPESVAKGFRRYVAEAHGGQTPDLRHGTLLSQFNLWLEAQGQRPTTLPALREALGAQPQCADPTPITGADGCSCPVTLAQCSQCSGSNWGPSGRHTPDGAEVWSCLDCAHPAPETPAPPVPPMPKPRPPGAIDSPCPGCGKPHRLFVPGSPHIPGEPDRDVLICGKCGCTEPACPECKRTNVVVDPLGIYCVDCRKRPGQPAPKPGPQTEPAPPPARRHHLGESPPPFGCPGCGRGDWLEGIYHWDCRHCQRIEMKA